MKIPYVNLLAVSLTLAAAFVIASCAQAPVVEEHEGYNLIRQSGPTLGYSPASGVGIIYEGKHAFKDLNRNGSLDVYEDWRCSIEERVADLASQLSKEEIAGLMLYSSHQNIPAQGTYGASTYNGLPYEQSGANAWDLSDRQRKFLEEDNLRHVLVVQVESPEVAAKWNNVSQAFVEGLGHGIPNNNSSDPRNGVGGGDVEFTAGAGGKISLWPNEIGMGATFDPELLREYGRIASDEYRALGFATCLSPQVDLCTEPRWMRFFGTYGEDPKLVADMAEAYCDGFQTSYGKDALYGAWGMKSVNAMAKHWPGGGAGEAGRDAHFGRGKYAVYPGGNYELHKIPFLQGAFKLKNGTEKAAAVMPYYTISLDQSSQKVANNFNYDIITNQLRRDAGYDGVVCTDWGVTADIVHPGIHSGKPYGIEELTVAQRHLQALTAGVDQFGGNDDKVPVLEAFELMIARDGEEAAMQRIRQSAQRLLRNIFRTGLFENPYLDPAQSAAIVGKPEYMAKGYEAQLKSIVMLKNHDAVLPMRDAATKVYIPQRFSPATNAFFGYVTPESMTTPVPETLCNKYFQSVPSADMADAAIVFIESPNSGWGHRLSEVYDVEKSGFGKPLDNYFIPQQNKGKVLMNGYYPISLQYEDYVAEYAREESLGQGDPMEQIANRSYKGKGVRTFNKSDLELVREVRSQLGVDKKLIVVVNCVNPTVFSEIEPLADAILVTFNVQKQAVLDICKGEFEPSALLPFQMPADMKAVELQYEDTPRDMSCYRDADGNIYDFAYGLNWSGVIDDARVKKYR